MPRSASVDGFKREHGMVGGGVETASCEPGGGGTVEIDLVEEIDRLGCPGHAGRLMLRSLMDTDVNVKWMG
jgi:hypothetical protein